MCFVCYKNGQGVEQDYKEAARLFRQAADLGDADAIKNLGVCYEYGRGVGKDYKEAARLYRQAADLGDADAIKNLGICYEYPTSNPQEVGPRRIAFLSDSLVTLHHADCRE